MSITEARSSPAALGVYVLLDESGSMNKWRGRAISAVNALIGQLNAANAPVLFSLSTFMDGVYPKITNEPVYEMPKLTDASYTPRGGTALNRAIMRGLKDLRENTNARAKVLIVVTDGECEGSSAQSDMAKFVAEGGLILWAGCGGGAEAMARQLGVPPHCTRSFSGGKLAEAMSDLGLMALEFVAKSG